MPALPFIQLWIWVSAFATLAGWTLSALGQLNRAGYAAAFAVFVVFIFFQRKNPVLAGVKNFRAKKLLRRFRRPLPFCFAVLAMVIFLGAALYPPDNYTAMTYRLPRVLQWLADGHWFWIHTTNYRMNDRACGIEWLSAPLLLFTHSTRLLFLLAFLPFLLLPGLTFSVLARLGVRPRVAWQWMWLLPTGYNFLLQAGSLANDTFPTVYALAAVDFALRARQSKSSAEVSASILSAALLTGAKASNLPLLLPWAVIMATGPWWRERPGGLFLRLVRCLPVLLVAAVISFLPMAILNARYCGDWSGAVLEPPIMTIKNPFVALIGNAFQLILGNISPPFFPWAEWWNAHAEGIFPKALVSISRHFDSGFFKLGEMPTEDTAGLGLGLSVLLAVSVLAKLFTRGGSGSIPATRDGGRAFRFWVVTAPWLALLAYGSKSGMTTAARLIAPYYPLLLPGLLGGEAPERLIRRPLWRILVMGNLVLAFGVLMLTPPRPLWPAQTVLSGLAARYPGSHLLARSRQVYSLYAKRFDSLAGLREMLPENVSIVGFAAGTDDAEISFWLPLGSRRVEDFLLTDPPAELRKRGIEYAVINDGQLPQGRATLDDWLNQSGAELLAATNATLKVATGPNNYYLVRLKP